MNLKMKTQGGVFLFFTLGPGFKRVRLQAPKTLCPSGQLAQTCKTSAFLHKNPSRVRGGVSGVGKGGKGGLDRVG